MNKKLLGSLLIVIVVPLLLSGCSFGKKTAANANQNVAATPKPKVNVIDFKDRPYVTIQPLEDRNMLEFRINKLPLQANMVEVLLEYDRNKGIQDAVLKDFTLDKIPYIDKLFLGSKSSGGHITYHEDVVGGKLTLTFSGGKDTYAVEVPWRYDDTQPHYTELATSDLKFQMTLDQPFRTPKVVVMQSPGLPAAVDSTVVAGPYLIRGVGPLPQVNGKVSIRLDDAIQNVKVLGFNGQKWQEFTTTVDGRVVTATVPLLETYVVVSQ